jgi:hypothetical protein
MLPATAIIASTITSKITDIKTRRLKAAVTKPRLSIQPQITNSILASHNLHLY